MCELVYRKGAESNSNAIKNHCSQLHHKNNVKNNRLTKVIVKGQTVSTVDNNGNRLCSVRKNGVLNVKFDYSSKDSSGSSQLRPTDRLSSTPKANLASASITNKEKETFDTKLTDLVLSSWDLLKGYTSNTEQFRSLLSLLRPGYSPISGTAIQSSLSQLKDKHINGTLSIISNQVIALVVDRVDRVLVVNGRFIDESFRLKSVLLHVIEASPELVYRRIDKSHEKLQKEQKIVSSVKIRFFIKLPIT